MKKEKQAEKVTDSGDVVADDVLYSLTRLADASCAQNWLVRDIDSIKVLSRYTLQIHLTKPNHLFLRFLSFAPASIVPRDVYEENREGMTDLPVGSGPYKVTKWSSGVCVLEAFDPHFQGRAFIDRIEIIIVPETNNEFLLEPKSNLLVVWSGEAAVHSARDWEEAEDLCGSSLLTVNLKKEGALQDIHFRKALYHLINRQKMIVELGEPRLYPSRNFQVNGRPSFFDKDWKGDEALNLLSQSQYQGEPLQLFTYSRHAPDAFWLKHEYKTYGIHVHVNLVSWRDMLKKENMEKADLILFEALLSEGMIRLIEYYQSSNSFIRSHLDDKLSSFVDRNISELLAEPNDESRQQILQKIEQELKDQYVMIFLVYKTVSTMSHPSLRGVKVSPSGWVDFKNIWFK
nr:ABC transporter substrate-binding protein [Aneurinibacillus terranovensis]